MDKVVFSGYFIMVVQYVCRMQKIFIKVRNANSLYQMTINVVMQCTFIGSHWKS